MGYLSSKKQDKQIIAYSSVTNNIF